MAGYVCRTCLFVSTNEFSFKKVDKVRDALESYVPEIKNFLLPNCILCEHCYQFLKCMKKFREKCLENQHRLCSFNMNNIRENCDRAIADTRWQQVQQQLFAPQNSSRIDKNNQGLQSFRTSGTNNGELVNDLTVSRNVTNNASLRSNQGHKRYSNGVLAYAPPALAPPIDLSLQNVSTSTVLRSMRRPGYKKSIGAIISGSDRTPSESNKSKIDHVQASVFEPSIPSETNSKVTVSNSKSFKKSSENPKENVQTLPTTPPRKLKNLRVTDAVFENLKKQIANKGTSTGKPPKRVAENLTKTWPSEMPILASADDSDLEIVESDNENNGKTVVELKIRRRKSVIVTDTYPTLSPIVSSNSIEQAVNISQEPNAVIIENDGNSNGNMDLNHNHHNEFEDMPVLTKVKEEAPEENNPGFFNKKNAEGLYVCRMCTKIYKTSQGLYNHTKDIHSKDLKFFHCGFCSFFTLWRSALRKHFLNYHAGPTKSTGSHTETMQEIRQSKSKPASDSNIQVLDLPTAEKKIECKTPFSKRLKELKKVATLPSASKLNQVVMTCFVPDCTFKTMSEIILKQHLMSRHNIFEIKA